jgi:hypothetical protein
MRNLSDKETQERLERTVIVGMVKLLAGSVCVSFGANPWLGMATFFLGLFLVEVANWTIRHLSVAIENGRYNDGPREP